MAPKGKFEQLSEAESMEALAAAMMIAEAVKAQRNAGEPIGDAPLGDGRTLKDLSQKERRALIKSFQFVYSGLKIEAFKRGHLDGPTGLQ